MDCKWKHMNLEFRQIDVDQLPEEFLKQIGDRAYQLSFVQCFPSYKTWKNITLHCQNLQKVSFAPDFRKFGRDDYDSFTPHFRNFGRDDYDDVGLLSYWFLRKSLKMNEELICKNVRSLEFTIELPWEKKDLDIFETFPDLTNLKVNASREGLISFSKFNIPSDDMTFPKIVSGFRCELDRSTPSPLWK